MSFSYFHFVCLTLLVVVGEWKGGLSVEAAISKYVTVPVPKSPYKNYCEDELLYRPYIKWYKGRREAVRTGIAEKVLGPGFHKEFLGPTRQNTYICVNGLAWLYFSVTTRTSTVYETPRLHKYVHHCFMVNGVPGPGPHEEFKSLLAILLVGNKKDYRRPSAQLFPAPYNNRSDKTEEEFTATSVFVIGEDTECVLTKGEVPMEFRVRNDNGAVAGGTSPPPREPSDGSTVFCKLSYRNLVGNLLSKEDTTAKVLLRNNAPLKLKGCWNPENYTEAFKNYTIDQKKFYDELVKASPTEKWPKLYDELIKLEDYLTGKGVIEVENSKIDADPCDPVGPCTEENIKTDFDKEALTDPAASDADKKANLLTKQLPIMLRNYRSQVFKAKKALEEAVATATKLYGDAEKSTGDAVAEEKNLEQPRKDLAAAIKAAEDDYKEKGVKDPTLYAAVTTAEDALRTAELIYIGKMNTAQLDLSLAESANQTVAALLVRGFVQKEYARYVKVYKIAAKGGSVPLVPKDLDPIPVSDTLTIAKAEVDKELTEDPEEDDKTAIEKDRDSNKTCGRLPNKTETCKGATPEKVRSCLLFKANLNKKAEGTGEWKSEDEWRQEVIDLVSDIFVQMTPRGTISNPKGYVNSVNSIAKAYLTDYMSAGGTPTTTPGPAPAPTPTPAPTPGPNLNPRRPFYDQIMVALKECKENNIVLQFDREDDRVVLLKKQGKNVKRLLVEENWEQADDEYVFNWAVDNMWFMFTSVLGICMPAYEFSIPLISSKFYTHYTEDFFYPVAREWVNNRDNQVLRLICGEWFKSPWPKRIMEASFVHSGDLRYRPPRKLYVNDLSEGNFFTEGPLKGTAGFYDA